MNEQKIRVAIQPMARPQVCWSAGVVFLSLSLAGCGTTSGFKAPSGKSAVDLSPFTRVVVKDFTDEASEKMKDPDREKKAAEMKRVTKSFADMLALEIGQKRIFDQVARTGAQDEKTLIVGGLITRYEEGSPFARSLVGMGAGSSYFDAQVEFRCGGSGELLGTIEANRHSWVLSSVIPADQAPDTFMRETARIVADEIPKLRSAKRARSVADRK